MTSWKASAESELQRDRSLLDARDLYIRAGTLSTSLMVWAHVHSEEYRPEIRAILDDCRAIQDALGRFEEQVWFGGGVQDYIQKAKLKGHRVEWGDVQVLMYAMAGRVMFTFRHKLTGHSVTALTAEDGSGPRMGLHGIDATREDAVALIDAITDHWSLIGTFTPDAETAIL